MQQYKKSEYDPSKLFPTVTGISLLGDDWTQLTNDCNTISGEVKQNTMAEHHISNEKYVGISCCGEKGPVTISIRQHYSFDDGVCRPTKKGINLKKKEWEALVSVMDLIGESIDNLKSEFVYDGKMVVTSVCVYFAEKKYYQYGIVETGKVFYTPLKNQLRYTKLI